VIKTIPVTQLRLGMYVHDVNASWIEHSFWRSRFKLGNERDLRRIRDSGVSELRIDTDRGLDVSHDTALAAAPESLPAELVSAEPCASVQPVTSERAALPTRPALKRDAALAQAAALYRRSVPKIASMFGQARLGKVVDSAEFEPLVDEISDSVLHNPGALISVVRLKRRDEYTYMHSVAVCALMLSQARQLGIEGDELRQAGMAGMLHDLGKALIPLDILNKPGKLTDDEFTLVKTHPARGHALLMEVGSVSALVLDVCLHHHEKIDGSGYPHGLAGEQISRFARMGAVCDVYDAVTSDRPYKAGWDPGEALRRMAQWKGHFDGPALQALVKAVGIYPVGSLVRLQSGRLAVVVEQNPAALLLPKVKTVYSLALQGRIEPQEIDLAARDCQDKVLGWEVPEPWSLGDLNALCGLPRP
jgi:HD-GYP domain-containing protein (c-di-GMP phosphodiesterase class II)